MVPHKILSDPKTAGPHPDPVAHFEQYLRARNLRMTPERRAVLETILARQGHFDADELLRLTWKRNRQVSRATLYRTLEHLCAAGLVRTLRFGRDPALFENIYGREHHDHMVCERCGAVIEFENEDMERLQNRICEQFAFRPTRHVMQIFGICEACRQREEAARGNS